MKKILNLFTLIIVLLLVACGGGGGQTEDSGRIQLKTLEKLDLSDYGCDLIIMIPKKYMNGAAEVRLNERGAIEVIVGFDFGIEIMYGDGDLELLKADLKEDLVFKSEIILEEENAIVYTQEILDSGVKIQNHFMYRATVGGNIYEVKDIVTRVYGVGMIDKMLECAKTLKTVI